MTDLETRIRNLHVEVPEGASPVELRQRATARGRRRVRGLAATTVLLIVGAGAAAVMILRDGPDADQVTTGPDAVEPNATPNIPFGDVTGVVVNVSPREDLVDGQMIEVSVEGLENLPGASIVLCAGDVSAAEATQSCDLDAVHNVQTGVTQPAAAPRQTLSVSRTIHIGRGADDPNSTRPYDCADEAAGCVLVVAPLDLPPRGVAVPLVFSDGQPEQEPVAKAEPNIGLQDGVHVTVTVEGLTPNRVFWLSVCEMDQGERLGRSCDWWSVEGTSDEEGTLVVPVPARAAIYDFVEGRRDCTAVSCAVVVSDSGAGVVAEVPVAFADGVVAPVPVLELDPPGPYTDRQVVTVHGRGFPQGMRLDEGLAQCPARRETSIEEICGYSDQRYVDVEADGTFTTTVRVHSDLQFSGPCTPEPGCVVAWVIPNGVLVASVPLDFE